MNDTIAAIATAHGVGGVAVVRVSGEKALETVCRYFNAGKTLSVRHATYGTFSDGEKSVDDVVVTYYKAPNSYTGEDVVEISCHGSSYIQREILKVLIDNGCRMAERGEFTKRAFLNGKMDLAQAEAVADLIGAKGKAAHRIAMAQMKGNVSERLRELRSKLVELAALVELELDFSDHEDVVFADREKLGETAEAIKHEIERLRRSFSQGNAIKNGIPVAIVGEPNVGKSTLINRLVGDDCAIVSDIAGTTRDTIEREVDIDGVMFRFVDTAGIRESDDQIERLGIERSRRAIEKAKVVVLLTEKGVKGDIVGELRDGQKLIVCENKTDVGRCSGKFLGISALTGDNVDELKHRIYEAGVGDEMEDVTITNARHYEALGRGLEDIVRVIDGLNSGVETDLVAEDLRGCLFHLGEICGDEVTADEVLGTIFERFCIGK